MKTSDCKLTFTWAAVRSLSFCKRQPPPAPETFWRKLYLSVNEFTQNADWPPSAESVVSHGPLVILFILVPIVLHVISTLLEKPTQEEERADKEQAGKRCEMVAEMVEALDEDEMLESDTIGRIKLEALTHRIFELLQAPVSPEREATLRAALTWAANLAVKELRVAIAKTNEGSDPAYADGQKLDEALGEAGAVQSLMGKTGYWVEKALYDRMWAKVYEGRRCRRAQRRTGVLKAARMVLSARSSLKWVLLHSAVSVGRASMQATTSYYRASVLESFVGGDPNSGWEGFQLAAQALLCVELIDTLLGLLVSFLRARGQVKMGQELRIMFFDALLKKDLHYWTTKKGPWHEMISEVFHLDHAISDFMSIPEEFLTLLVTIGTHASLVLNRSSSMLVLMLAVNWGTTLFNWGFGWVQGRLEERATRGIIEPSMDDFTWVHALNPEYVPTFQSFVRGPAEKLSFARFLASQLRMERATTVVRSFAAPLQSAVADGATILQYASAGRLVQSGGVGVGQANALMSSASGVGYDTQEMIASWRSAQAKAQPLAKAWDLCTLPAKIDPDKGLTPPGRAKGHIRFEGVEFKYPEREVLVLQGASFEVQAGQVLGMTGSAGCGKSTALRLLERFYDVTGGRILLDGKDIRDYSPDWLRAQIATVAQEPKLLPFTIRENIAFGCPTEPTLEQIYSACKAANIYDALMDKDKFPEGLRTKMNAVTNVSGGEKQRIAIARAILADPPILLLDEATSALDEENQEKVQAALNKLMAGRTTLIIAHRLSTIRSADKIVAFDGGKVVECGTHNELLKQEGSIYAKLWHKQSGNGPAEETEVEAHHEEAHMEEELFSSQVQLSVATRLATIERRLLESTPDDKAALRARQKELLQLTAQLRQHAQAVEQQRADSVLGQTAQLVMEEKVVSLFQRALASGQAHRALSFNSAPGLADALPASPARRSLQRIARKVMHQNREQASAVDADAAPVPLMPRRNLTEGSPRRNSTMHELHARGP